MNNRFKFRVWWEKEKRYRIDVKMYPAEHFCQKDFIVEQCTGLKDKNGNLIYEGDIIRFCLNTRGYVLAYERAVVWDNESASFMIVSNLDQVKPRTKRQMPNTKTHNIEIIGNIHKQKDVK